VNERGLPPAARNPITQTGIFITTVSAALFLLFFAIDLFKVHTNPYLGIVFFLILPAGFLLGLMLIPIGIFRERRRRLKGLPRANGGCPASTSTTSASAASSPPSAC